VLHSREPNSAALGYARFVFAEVASSSPPVSSTYIPPIDIAPLFPRRHYTRQSRANVPMKFKSLGGFHRPKPGRYRSVFIQMKAPSLFSVGSSN